MMINTFRTIMIYQLLCLRTNNQYTRMRTFPIERNWCDTLSKWLVVVLQNCYQFQHTSRVYSALMRVSNFDRSDQPYSDLNSKLRNYIFEPINTVSVANLSDIEN